MRDGPRDVAVEKEVAVRQKPDLAANPRMLGARVRAEMHRLITALARKKYEDAAEMLPTSSGWTPERLEAELAPYWAVHASIDTTPKARQPTLTTLVPGEARTWTVRHSILSPDGEADWMLEGEVDLRGRLDADEALFDLRRIGE
jgi:hypothetical protein